MELIHLKINDDNALLMTRHGVRASGDGLGGQHDEKQYASVPQQDETGEHSRPWRSTPHLTTSFAGPHNTGEKKKRQN